MDEIRPTHDRNINIRNKVIELVFVALVLFASICLAVIYYAWFRGDPGPSPDAKIIARINQIQAQAEIYYQQNTTGLGYGGLGCIEAKDDIGTVCEYIKNVAGSYPIFYISESGDAYCSYIRLMGKKKGDVGYWCIDSLGSHVEVKENPPSTCSISSFSCK